MVDNPQAFPGNDSEHCNGEFAHHSMTMRDYFAAKWDFGCGEEGFASSWAEAVTGEKPPTWEPGNYLDCVKWWASAEAKARYIMADAMLEARNA